VGVAISQQRFFASADPQAKTVAKIQRNSVIIA